MSYGYRSWRDRNASFESSEFIAGTSGDERMPRAMLDSLRDELVDALKRNSTRNNAERGPSGADHAVHHTKLFFNTHTIRDPARWIWNKKMLDALMTALHDDTITISTADDAFAFGTIFSNVLHWAQRAVVHYAKTGELLDLVKVIHEDYVSASEIPSGPYEVPREMMLFKIMRVYSFDMDHAADDVAAMPLEMRTQFANISDPVTDEERESYRKYAQSPATYAHAFDYTAYLGKKGGG